MGLKREEEKKKYEDHVERYISKWNPANVWERVRVESERNRRCNEEIQCENWKL